MPDIFFSFRQITPPTTYYFFSLKKFKLMATEYRITIPKGTYSTKNRVIESLRELIRTIDAETPEDVDTYIFDDGVLSVQVEKTKDETPRKDNAPIKRKQNPYRFKIMRADGRIIGCGTDRGSWRTLEQARREVDYSKGEKIIEHDGVNVLWETL